MDCNAWRVNGGKAFRKSISLWKVGFRSWGSCVKPKKLELGVLLLLTRLTQGDFSVIPRSKDRLRSVLSTSNITAPKCCYPLII